MGSIYNYQIDNWANLSSNHVTYSSLYLRTVTERRCSKKINEEINPWCRKNLQGFSQIGIHIAFFEYAEDKMLFSLVWSGERF